MILYCIFLHEIAKKSLDEVLITSLISLGYITIMNQRLGLFASRAINSLARAPPSRKLYTDHIYPYPFKYFNEYKYPSVQCYRENWEIPQRFQKREMVVGVWMMRLFWTYWFWSFFHDPNALFGHFHLPDPNLWTDEELGIPPLEAGSYKDWVDKAVAEE